MIDLIDICKGFIEKLVKDTKDSDNLDIVNNNIVDPLKKYFYENTKNYIYIFIIIILFLVIISILNLMIVIKIYIQK